MRYSTTICMPLETCRRDQPGDELHIRRRYRKGRNLERRHSITNHGAKCGNSVMSGDFLLVEPRRAHEVPDTSQSAGPCLSQWARRAPAPADATGEKEQDFVGCGGLLIWARRSRSSAG